MVLVVGATVVTPETATVAPDTPALERALTMPALRLPDEAVVEKVEAEPEEAKPVTVVVAEAPAARRRRRRVVVRKLYMDTCVVWTPGERERERHEEMREGQRV